MGGLKVNSEVKVALIKQVTFKQNIEGARGVSYMAN